MRISPSYFLSFLCRDLPTQGLSSLCAKFYQTQVLHLKLLPGTWLNQDRLFSNHNANIICWDISVVHTMSNVQNKETCISSTPNICSFCWEHSYLFLLVRLKSLIFVKHWHLTVQKNIKDCSSYASVTLSLHPYVISFLCALWNGISQIAFSWQLGVRRLRGRGLAVGSKSLEKTLRT